MTKTERLEKKQEKKGQKILARQGFKRVFGYMVKDTRLWILLVVFTAGSAVFGAFSGYFTGRLIDHVVSGGAFFDRLLYINVALRLLDLVFFPMKGYIAKMLGIRLNYQLRVDTMKKLMQVNMESVHELNTGNALGKIESALGRMQSFASDHLYLLVECICSLSAALAASFMLNTALSLTLILLLPVLFFIQAFIAKPLQKVGKKVNESFGSMGEKANEIVTLNQLIKAYSLEDRKMREFDEVMVNLRRVAVKSSFVFGVNDLISTLVSALPAIVAVAAGGIFMVNGMYGVTIGIVVAFVELSGDITGPLSRFEWIFGNISEAFGHLVKLNDIWSLPEEESGSFCGEIEGDTVIEFRDVGFGYKNNKPLFDGLSFTLERGKTTAFVGPSGCGKTTIFKLINGYYRAQSGSIIIGGHEISEWNLESLRAGLAVVSQESFLFPFSVRENLLFGRQGASDEQLDEAAEKANILEFIRAHPDGYDAEVGERGVKLSGGQRQRMSIARAFLKDSNIMLLDEPTSALDTATEHEIQGALSALGEGRTTVVIAHRLSTVKDADLIYCMEEGRISEAGTHDQLMEKGGVYARLYRIQQEETDGEYGLDESEVSV